MNDFTGQQCLSLKFCTWKIREIQSDIKEGFFPLQTRLLFIANKTSFEHKQASFTNPNYYCPTENL